jgi:hypothetical protein
MTEFLAVSSSTRQGPFTSDPQWQLGYETSWNSFSTAHFVVKTPSPISLNNKSLKLMSAIVPNTIYNVNSYNQVIDINDNGAVIAVTLAQGYYTTIHEMATELQTKINAASANTWTVVGSDTTQYLTFTSTANFILLFNTGANAGVRNILWRMLGFSNSSGTIPIDTTNGLSAVSNFPVNLFYTENAFIRFRFGSTMNQPTTSIGRYSESYTMILPYLTNPRSTGLISGRDFPYCFSPGLSSFDTIEVIISDDRGTVLSHNNMDWHFYFKIV